MAPVLAIFGGSFNPPHVAHQMAVLWVLETQPVDRVLIIPTWKHAFDKQLAPWGDRLEMARLAMAPLGPRVEVSAIEQELGGEPNYTLHTLQALGRRRPGASFRLIIGADILPDRDKWYRWPEVEALAPPIVVGRQGHPSEAPVDLPAISSTLIRFRLGRGEPVQGLVPAEVAAYIAARGLYR